MKFGAANALTAMPATYYCLLFLGVPLFRSTTSRFVLASISCSAESATPPRMGPRPDRTTEIHSTAEYTYPANIYMQRPRIQTQTVLVQRTGHDILIRLDWNVRRKTCDPLPRNRCPYFHRASCFSVHCLVRPGNIEVFVLIYLILFFIS